MLGAETRHSFAPNRWTMPLPPSAQLPLQRITSADEEIGLRVSPIKNRDVRLIFAFVADGRVVFGDPMFGAKINTGTDLNWKCDRSEPNVHKERDQAVRCEELAWFDIAMDHEQSPLVAVWRDACNLPTA